MPFSEQPPTPKSLCNIKMVPKQNVYLNKGRRNFNVIGIDWHEMAQSPNYFSAAKHTDTVGKFIGKKLVIDILINTLDQNPKKIHAIGHSLGAHISGHIGREVKKRNNAKIGRVTGRYILVMSPSQAGSSHSLAWLSS